MIGVHSSSTSSVLPVLTAPVVGCVFARAEGFRHRRSMIWVQTPSLSLVSPGWVRADLSYPISTLEVMEFEVSLRLDRDGFLRRACPSCNREFKWLPSDDSEPPPDGRYGCPYCRARQDLNDFYTEEQVAYIQGLVGEKVVSQLEAEGWTAKAHAGPPQPDEPDDMIRVDFHCHPSEPVKVFEEWELSQSVYCILCGEPG